MYSLNLLILIQLNCQFSRTSIARKMKKVVLYRITATPSAGEVIYTPPSAAEMPSMMSEMVKWLNSELDNN